MMEGRVEIPDETSLTTKEDADKAIAGIGLDDDE
jgi:hypothetical protein